MTLPRDSSEFWETVLDTMTEGLMLIEKGGTITFVNRAMERLTGYAREELVGKKCSVLDFDCCPTEPASQKRGPCPLFKYGKVVDRYSSLRRKDGTLLTVLKNAAVIPSDRGDALCAVEIQTDVTKLKQTEDEVRHLRSILEGRYVFEGIVGASPQIKVLIDLIGKAAAWDAPVLIYGESGSGKELVASAIHKLGNKSNGPFIRVNCAALNQSLLESELFGHVKGAFTGADRTTKGRFEAAHTGDIFLDEIGDMPLATQVKLLRVLEKKEVERVGDYRPIPIDVRIITATHRDLRALIAAGLFREDLFYRLNVIPLVIPPLRQRSGDIPLLVNHFIREISERSCKCVAGVAPDAMELLTSYSWPGNVRELINVIEYAFVVCSGGVVTRSHLPDMSLSSHVSPPVNYAVLNMKTERDRLVGALNATNGKKAAAAELLGVSRQTLWSWIKKHGIDVKRLCAVPDTKGRA
ncbi:MAG: sigma 54-interacting transcriptional regulator [Desulfomonile tiedjei]|uniref:Sigma 54-interacting transcriptional regulator n=1 Tax=Desulfomonile tiedjei TaxID=2358 RepID=A0A9D6Z3B7_9BACT|nr:sigma 54-interacting transcriptional regulator [Desulfomonile tiedjei]